MKFLLKLFLIVALIGTGALAYGLWTGMTPGERYHIVDKARSGELESLGESVKFKASEELERQRRKAKEAAADMLEEVSGRIVDGASRRIQAGTEAAAADAKAGILEQIETELRGPAGTPSVGAKPSAGD